MGANTLQLVECFVAMGQVLAVTFSTGSGCLGGLGDQVLDGRRTGLQGTPHVPALGRHLLNKADLLSNLISFDTSAPLAQGKPAPRPLPPYSMDT